MQEIGFFQIISILIPTIIPAILVSFTTINVEKIKSGKGSFFKKICDDIELLVADVTEIKGFVKKVSDEDDIFSDITKVLNDDLVYMRDTQSRVFLHNSYTVFAKFIDETLSTDFTQKSCDLIVERINILFEDLKKQCVENISEKFSKMFFQDIEGINNHFKNDIQSLFCTTTNSKTTRFKDSCKNYFNRYMARLAESKYNFDIFEASKKGAEK